jgi:hypothetical protein
MARKVPVRLALLLLAAAIAVTTWGWLVEDDDLGLVGAGFLAGAGVLAFAVSRISSHEVPVQEES